MLCIFVLCLFVYLNIVSLSLKHTNIKLHENQLQVMLLLQISIYVAAYVVCQNQSLICLESCRRRQLLMQTASEVLDQRYRLSFPVVCRHSSLDVVQKFQEENQWLQTTHQRLLITQVHMNTKHPSVAATTCPISTARLLREKNRKISQSMQSWSCHGNLTAPSRFLCFCHFLYPLCLLFSRLGQQLPSSQCTAGQKRYHSSAPILSFSLPSAMRENSPAKLSWLNYIQRQAQFGRNMVFTWLQNIYFHHG